MTCFIFYLSTKGLPAVVFSLNIDIDQNIILKRICSVINSEYNSIHLDLEIEQKRQQNLIYQF